MTLSRSLTTRILHFLLLAIVIHQLIGSNFIERPLPGEDPELPYQLHTWIGIAGFVTVFAFWIWSLVRRRETSFSELIPWFSSARRQALFADIRKHVRILISFRLPDDDHGGLSSAVHGLGLLVVTAMAISGTLYYFVFQGTALGKLVLEAHEILSNFMWAYLIGHATLALIHQAMGHPIFAQMFWSMPTKPTSRSHTKRPE